MDPVQGVGSGMFITFCNIGNYSLGKIHGSCSKEIRPILGKWYLWFGAVSLTVGTGRSYTLCSASEQWLGYFSNPPLADLKMNRLNPTQPSIILLLPPPMMMGMFSSAVLFVSKITQKLLEGLQPHLVAICGIGQGRSISILVRIQSRKWIQDFFFPLPSTLQDRFFIFTFLFISQRIVHGSWWGKKICNN